MAEFGNQINNSPYGYVLNNPLTLADPTGMVAESVHDLIKKAWDQGEGTYDNEGNKIEENDETECCKDNVLLIKPGSDLSEEFTRGFNTLFGNTGMAFSSATLLVSVDELTSLMQNAKGQATFGNFSGKIILDGTETTAEIVKKFEALGAKNLDKTKVANLLKGGGQYLFFMGSGFSAAEGIINMREGKFKEAAVNGVDIGMGALGTYGSVIGGQFSLLYFGSQYIYRNGGKELGERRSAAMKNLSPQEAKKRFSCFIEGTKVIMGDLTVKNIEDVKLGDEILSVRMFSMEIETDTVIRIPETVVKYRKIKYSYENGTSNFSSPEHPYFVKGKGWCVFDLNEAKGEVSIPVKQIEKNDTVYFYEKGVLKETIIVDIEDTGEYVNMYNIEYVKNNNTFFANNILVHNKN